MSSVIYFGSHESGGPLTLVKWFVTAFKIWVVEGMMICTLIIFFTELKMRREQKWNQII